ncbi:MerR family transcriptional regulator [Limosilactobacillus balticus]|uniref:MerR family transcriptional regulator n=1 Tax=Limosilactobacillus balticus TaxID=2759747 RepID=A0ABS8REH4_9LACO|nr:MerR family transcriptional regulator [Limosilactobacillus balticus]MCD7138496.1 MerR family transcriptional regulator [Limosilactobacillus balticus]
MYTTGQLAKKCNISIRTIQYYDRRGLLHAKRTENGLRHYNDHDLKQLQEILIYKQLGFSLKDIQQIINDPDNNTLKSLIVNQQRKLKQEIKDASEQLASLSQLENFLNKQYDFPENISQSIFDKIKKVKKLKQFRIKLLLIGSIIDFILWGSILGFLFYQKNLLWLLLGILCTVVLTWYITINYYHHTCYICPHCYHQFRVSLKKWLFARHTPNTRYLKCNKCSHKNYCIEEYY